MESQSFIDLMDHNSELGKKRLAYCLGYVEEDKTGLFDELMKEIKVSVRYLGIFGYFDDEDDEKDDRQVLAVRIENTRTGKKITFRYGMSVNDTAILLGLDSTADGREYMARHCSRPSKEGYNYGKEKAEVFRGMLYGILSCMQAEAYCPETFEDFCAEYGYEDDSIRAEKAFKACREMARKIRSVIDERYFDALPS